MQGVTLIIAIIGVLIVLSLKPTRALAAYVIILLWYPSYLRMSIGTIDISASRVIITVLLLRCVCDNRLSRQFKWNRLDTWYTIGLAICTLVFVTTRPFGLAAENRAGFLMDTWFVYMTARYCICNRKDVASVVKVIAFGLVPLAILAGYESITDHYIFYPLRKYCPWSPIVAIYPTRWGLSRAWGPFSHPIMLGSIFGMFLPLIWAMRRNKGNWQTLAYLLSASAVLGMFFTVSSTIWMMMVMLIAFLMMERHAKLVKSLLLCIVLGCVALEIVSPVPFYRWLGARMDLSGGGGWYQRTVIIECGMRDISQWFWLGYGGRDPGWGAPVGMDFTDLNNQFLFNAVETGIWGVLSLCGILAVAYRGIVRGYKKTRSRELKSLYWSFGCILTAVILTWFGACYFGQPTMIFYLIMGMIGSSFRFAETEAKAVSVRTVESLVSYEPAPVIGQRIYPPFHGAEGTGPINS